jgi:hypothetical protein
VSTAESQGPRPPMELLSGRVRQARAALHRERQGRAASPELDLARRQLVSALRDYTRALERCRLPVPHALHTELRIHERLCEGSPDR